MATRSRIAVMQKDGSIKSIYCHNDGYPEHVGNMLFNYYNTYKKANSLINLGSLSSIHENLTPKSKTHHFDNREEGVVVAYHRDRGEELTINTHESVYEFEKSNCLEGYNYLFDSGYWFVLGAGSTWVRLTDEIVKNGLPE